MFALLIYSLPISIINTDNIKDTSIITTDNINHQLFNLGYHYFYQKTKITLSNRTKHLGNNTYYYIINSFEITIPNYPDTIIDSTHVYLNTINNNLDTVSVEFFKLWEIMFIFNLITKHMSVFIINDDGNIVHSIISYKLKLLDNNNIEKDVIFIKNNSSINNDKLIDYYKKKFPKLIQNKKSNDKYSLIIANGRLLDLIDNINEEQYSYKLLLEEIIYILSNQQNDGTCVLKLVETFTITSLKLIYILSSFYDNVYIYKPYFSRISDSEKYLVCKNFKSTTNINIVIKSLEEYVDLLDENNFSIFPKLILPNEWLLMIKYINIKIANSQQIILNEIIKFINENDPFGDKYHVYRNKQIEATKWWRSVFFPPSFNLYNTNKSDIDKQFTQSIEKHNAEFKKFISNFI